VWTYRDTPVFGGVTGVEYHSPEENGTSLVVVNRPMHDPTLNGLFPDVTYRSPCIGQRARTGPNTWESTLVGYGRTATPGEVAYILTATRTETILADGAMQIVGHAKLYSGRDTPEDSPHPAFGALHDQDTEPRDGQPDADEESIWEGDFEKIGVRLPMPTLPEQTYQPGDANRDGAFDQLDLIAVLKAGKYQTGEPASWEQGDWNGDEVFDSLDLVLAQETGAYSIQLDYYDTAAIWTYRDAPMFGGITAVEYHSPEENGTSLVVVNRPMHDPTLNGLFPDVSYRSPCIGQRVRTGPNTWESMLVGYGRTAAPGEIAYILTATRTESILADGTMQIVGHAELYSGRDTPEDSPHPAFGALHDQDTEPRDGQPDADEQPLWEGDFEKMAHPVPTFPGPADGQASESTDYYDPAAVWTYRDVPVFGGITAVEYHSPEENGTSLAVVNRPMHDPTLNGLFPDVTYRSPCIGNRIRTGPSTWESTLVGYGRTAVPGEIAYILTATRTETILADGTMQIVGHAKLYSGRDTPDDSPHPVFGALHDQDTEPRDGQPDAGEEALWEGDFEKIGYRLLPLPGQPPEG
jgi:hypothetical protein